MLPEVDSRRLRLVGLSAGVLVGHLWLADRVLPSRLGDGGADRLIKRIDVAFVRELQPAEPAPVAPAPRLRRRPAAAVAPAAAASAPEPALARIEPLPPASAVAEISAPPLPAAVVGPAAQVPASAPAAAFEWPPSTRLSYTLSGNFRGPVEGQARVEWLRSGSRYQVTMEASVGPAFAPLMTRRVSSEGEITADGLSPQRYEEETHMVLREPRRVSITLGADRVRLANGRELPRPAGVQDSASQFVHLTWLFTTQPQWLTRGRSIELPLALPRHVLPWTYDVLETETLHTPAGPVQAVHVKPRRPPPAEGRPSGDLTAEMWVAPSLQYLPVRIIVRQDEQTYIDMLIERLPQQENRPTPERLRRSPSRGRRQRPGNAGSAAST